MPSSQLQPPSNSIEGTLLPDQFSEDQAISKLLTTNIFDLLEEEDEIPPKTFFLGQTFKNYRALCEFLELSPYSGRAKQHHIENLETYVSFSRKGQSLTISAIHKDCSIILPRQRKKKTSFWEEQLSILILDKMQETLSEKDGEHTFNLLILKTSSALTEFGFCASELDYISSLTLHDFLPELTKPVKFSDLRPKTPLVTNGKFSLSNEIFTSLKDKLWKDCQQTLSRVLISLAKQNILIYNYDNVVLDAPFANSRPASLEENTLILSLTVETLKEFKLSSIEEVFRLKKDREFFLARNRALAKQNIRCCQKAHILTFSPTTFDFGKTYKASLEAKLSAKLKINDRSFSNLLAFYKKQTSCPESIKIILSILEAVVKLES